jgi:hypothetical protein
MKPCISFSNKLVPILKTIVENKELHAKWLNTLSYLENCGARKIALAEHPTQVQKEMLKHAAEEFRHALYLKQQIMRLGVFLPDYRRASLLGSWAAYHFLARLETQVARIGKIQNIRHPLGTYWLVTYAIELRAKELYTLYQYVLKEYASPVRVTSIILEEDEHLKEMEEALKAIEEYDMYRQFVVEIEGELFCRFLSELL